MLILKSQKRKVLISLKQIETNIIKKWIEFIFFCFV